MVASWVKTSPVGDHTDPATPGLQLRVRKKRAGLSRSWYFRYKWHSNPVRVLLGHVPGTDLVEAREEAIKLRKALDAGVDPRRARPRRSPVFTRSAEPGAPVAYDKHSVEYLVREFMERHVKPVRKRPEYVQAIFDRDVLPAWRGRDARMIEPTEVLDLLDAIVERGSRVMANRTAAVLTQLFKFAIHRRIVASSPVQLLYLPGGREKSRDRILTDEELAIFLRNPIAATRFRRLAHAMTALLLTGQRRGELAAAKWSEIDFDAKAWTIPPENSKTGRGHIVPLSDWALTEFKELQQLAGRSAFVLPSNDGLTGIDAKLLTRGVARCQTRMRELGLGAFTLHDLRRTCRTGLSRLKVQPHIAERVLNHAQDRIAGTYDVWDYVDEKRDALNRWAEHLSALLISDRTSSGQSHAKAA